MTLSLSSAMLRHIAREIALGRPLFALLRAAEYLDCKNPLWRSFVETALPAFSDKRYYPARPILSKILNGVRFGELSESERLMLRAVAEPISERRFPGVSARRRTMRAISERTPRLIRKF